MKHQTPFLILLLLLSSLSAYSQDTTRIESFVQFSGKVVQFDNGDPIQGVRVTNLTRGTMAFSNANGIFSIVVAPEDKVQLSHIGMSHQFYTIPARSDSKIYREFTLDIEPEKIKEVLVSGLPPIDELGERLMALQIDEDPARQLALENPDLFNILDTIIAHEPSLLSFKNGKVESSPISWFYEKVYKKIKEKLPKPARKEDLPKFKKRDQEISN